MEEVPAGTLVTASALDSVRLSVYPSASRTVTVNVASACGGEPTATLIGCTLGVPSGEHLSSDKK